MKNTTLFLPGLHLSTLRRTPRSAAQKLADQRIKIQRHSLSRLSACFKSLIPNNTFSQHNAGAFSRRRLFTKENTFWAFFSQVLNADSGCREVVRKIQAYAATKGLAIPSSSTSAYCQARAKLAQDALDSILEHTGQVLQHRARQDRWKGRRVVVVDGTGLSMPDTEANQDCWPQQSSQKAGCGFPQLRLCACFCLQSGGLLSYRMGNRKKQELPLLREQWDTFEAGDIMLGDKGFCSYYDVSQLQNRAVDSVFTVARRKPVRRSDAVAVLGKDDLLISWPKPAWNKVLSYTKTEWEALPDELQLRQIKVTINQSGFRKKQYYLVTTLTDPTTYSSQDLAALYYQRWDVELFFRDIKTTMDMDILRCRTPEMVRKEIAMHWIVYNAIRLLIIEAAQQAKIRPREISFKASMQALRQWESELNLPNLTASKRHRLINVLYRVIAQAKLPHRPGRREPRCIKRRPKPYGLLTCHRHQMVEIPHRGRYRATTA